MDTTAPSSASAARKIKVLIVDDSALIRALLVELINRQPDMIAVGAARDALVAREMIRNLDPDVLTLDIEMPHMDGLDFLEKLMRLRPMAVVMMSTMTERGGDLTARALDLGAVSFVTKPKVGIESGFHADSKEIVDKIRLAARRSFPSARVHGPAPVSPSRGVLATRAGTEKLIVVGASTGGTEAIKTLLMGMPPDAPGILIVQHMPAGFTAQFSQRLDRLCRIRVKEAEDGERVLSGTAYIAPGGRHMRVARSGAQFITVLSDDAPLNRHRPSVGALFSAVARCAGPNVIGIMLTGMGNDGATAMLEMRQAGAWNVAQDEASCVVFGMPKVAIEAGAVHEVLPLASIAERALMRLRTTSESAHASQP